MIVKADGKDVTSSDDVRSAIVAKKPGDKMTVVVQHATAARRPST